MTIEEKISRLKAISFDRLFDRIIKDNSKKILDMNRDQMYEDGVMDIANPGNTLQYAPSTIKSKKRAKYNKTEFITLKWQGDFHKSVKIKITPNEIFFVSDNEIWGQYLETQDRFKNALGLTDENEDALRDLVKEEMIKRLENVV